LKEIPENGADVAHLQELHKPATFAGNFISKIPFYDLLTKCLYFEWDANWSICSEPDQHIANISLNSRYILFGYPFIVANFSIQQIGPALVHLKFKSTFLGEVSGAFIQIITPLEPNKHRIIHQLYTEPGLRGALFSKFALNGETRMVCIFRTNKYYSAK
jgi:cholesterol 7-dehydrogenase